MKEVCNFNLKKYNTFGISAMCKRFIEFETVREVQTFIQSGGLAADSEILKYFVIGEGSNLLLTGDYDGIVMHSAIKGIEVTCQENDVFLRVGSGENWDELVDMAIKNGWYGIENLSGIPGEVGATAVQNIGAYGVEAKDFIHRVEAVSLKDGSPVMFSNADCQYAYRQSRFKTEWNNQYFVTHVTYRLSKTHIPCVNYGGINARLDAAGIIAPTASEIRQVVLDIRNEKLPNPKIEGNAGSFFVNPIVDRAKFEAIQEDYPNMPHYRVDDTKEKIPAGWLIEQCGWKGKTHGRAGVHSKQALILVNRGEATGKDILCLCDEIRKDVNNKFGIMIYPEVNVR